MASDWEVVSLVEHCKKIGSGATPRGGSSVYLEEGEITLIRSQNVYNEGFKRDGLVFITEEAAEKLKNVIVEENDILLNITGDSVARVCMVDNQVLPARVNQHVSIIRPKESSFNPLYLRYQLVSPQVQQLLLNYASAGATRHALTKSMIENLGIPKPDLDTQNNIAHILGSLDDKIELNRQMNETLEAMAQALFKSWFVDFDPVIDNARAAGKAIPDELFERAEQRKAIDKTDNSDIQDLFTNEFEFTEEMGWIPKGWRVRNLSEMVSVIIDHRGKTPKKLGGDWAESGYPAISAKNIKGNKLVRPDTIRFVDKDIYDKWMKVPLEVGDVIMTSEAPLGELYYLNSKIDYLLSQRLYAIRADKVNCTGSYLFYWFQTEFGSAEIQNRATGTTVFGIKQSELRKVLVLCPPSSVLEKFDTYSQGLLGKMDANDLSSTELAKLRDTLLPKLMSGELRISDAEVLVEEVL